MEIFYSILFYSILFYSILFYSILFYSILRYPMLSYAAAGVLYLWQRGFHGYMISLELWCSYSLGNMGNGQKVAL